MATLKIITWKDGHSTADWFECDFQPIEVEIPPLLQIVKAYGKFRKFVWPKNVSQSMLFLMSELGELADAIVNEMADWVRNNPGRERKIGPEIGDVLMMLIVTASFFDIDPLQAMLDKMKSKGFEL